MVSQQTSDSGLKYNWRNQLTPRKKSGVVGMQTVTTHFTTDELSKMQEKNASLTSKEALEIDYLSKYGVVRAVPVVEAVEPVVPVVAVADNSVLSTLIAKFEMALKNAKTNPTATQMIEKINSLTVEQSIKDALVQKFCPTVVDEISF